MKKITKTKDIQLVIEPPHHLANYLCGTRPDGTWGQLPYQSREWFDRYEEKLNEWIKEFEAFVRDHRSQDAVTMWAKRDEVDVCSHCGTEWEVDDIDGKLSCLGCGEPVDECAEGQQEPTVR